MNRNLALASAAGLLVAATLAGWQGCKPSGPRATVTVSLRVRVDPPSETGFVAAQAGSARFKYEIGKKARVKPVLAQKLAVKALTNTSVVEAQVGVATKDEGRRYADAFVETLQAQCGERARLTLVDSSVR